MMDLIIVERGLQLTEGGGGGERLVFCGLTHGARRGRGPPQNENLPREHYSVLDGCNG